MNTSVATTTPVAPAAVQTDKHGFEISTCGRCGGGGSFSYCSMHGSTCFGCGGSGKVWTKRGKAARAHMVALQTRPMAELAVGHFLWDDTFGYKARFLPVLSIKESGSYSEAAGVRNYYVNIETRRCLHGVFPTSTVRFVRDEADRLATVAAALAYQATLGVSGKPLKRSPN